MKYEWIDEYLLKIRCKRKIITPYFTPFAGVNMPKYAYIMPTY